MKNQNPTDRNSQKAKYYSESIRLTTETIQACFDELPPEEQADFLQRMKGVHQTILHLYTQILTNHIATC